MKQNNNFQATLKSINTPQLTFVCVCVWESVFNIDAYIYMCVCVSTYRLTNLPLLHWILLGNYLNKHLVCCLRWRRRKCQRLRLPLYCNGHSSLAVFQWGAIRVSFPYSFYLLGTHNFRCQNYVFLLFILLSSRCSIIYFYTNACVCICVSGLAVMSTLIAL